MKVFGYLILSALVFTAAMLGGEPKSTQHIEITARRFYFEPSEVTIKKGDPVTITVRSEDVAHGLVIEELGVRLEVKKGQAKNVAVVPDTEGAFEGKCAHFCGKGHALMILTVHVVE